VLSMRGTAGELRTGYQRAARLGSWTLSVGDQALGYLNWVCEAVLTERSDYWLEHGRQHDLVLEVGEHTWRWRGVEFGTELGRITVRGNSRPEVI